MSRENRNPGWAQHMGRALVLATISACLAAHAQSNAFLRVDGVSGGSTDSRHAGWMDVRSFRFGVSNVVTGGGGGATVARFSTFDFIKPVDKASPLLLTSCATGEHHREATMELLRNVGPRLRYYVVTLSDVLIVSARAGAEKGAPDPQEAVSLNATKVSWTYTEFDFAGVPQTNHSAYWDLVRNVGGSGANPVLRLTLTPDESRLSGSLAWPALAGKVYRLYAAPNVDGPYQFAQEITATATGTMSQTVVFNNDRQFYQIEELP